METFAFHPVLLHNGPLEGLTKKEEKDLKQYTKKSAIHLTSINFSIITLFLPFLKRFKTTAPNPSFS